EPRTSCIPRDSRTEGCLRVRMRTAKGMRPCRAPAMEEAMLKQLTFGAALAVLISGSSTAAAGSAQILVIGPSDTPPLSEFGVLEACPELKPRLPGGLPGAEVVDCTHVFPAGQESESRAGP